MFVLQTLPYGFRSSSDVGSIGLSEMAWPSCDKAYAITMNRLHGLLPLRRARPV